MTKIVHTENSIYKIEQIYPSSTYRITKIAEARPSAFYSIGERIDADRVHLALGLGMTFWDNGRFRSMHTSRVTAIYDMV